MSQFVGLLMETDRGDIGSIQSSFGTSGKFRVNFPAGTDIKEGDPLYLRFKRYANDPKKAIHQDGSLPRARPGSRVDVPIKKKKSKTKNGAAHGGLATGDGGTAKNDVIGSNGSNDKDVKFGEVDKLKGDVLPNGKHTMSIVSGLFSMADDINKHKGRRVVCTTTEEEGVVDGSFGKMGKCRCLFEDGISAEVGSQVKLLP